MVVSGDEGEGKNERVGFNYIISILFPSDANMARCSHLFPLAVDLWVSMTLFSVSLKCFIIRKGKILDPCEILLI